MTGRYPGDRRRRSARSPFDRFLIDGEIVALDARGVSSFQRLQARMGLTRPAGRGARAGARARRGGVLRLPRPRRPRPPRACRSSARKACLERVLPPLGVARYGDHVEADGPGVPRGRLRRPARGHRGQARGRAPTSRGRSDAWLKIKCQRRQEFVIGGYTDPQGGRARFGALHLGLYDGGEARLRVQGRHRASTAPSSTGSGGSSSRSAGRRRRSRTGTPPGAGTTGSSPGSSRGAVHRMDAGRRDPPPDLPRAPGRRAPRGLPPRALGRGLGRQSSRLAASPRRDEGAGRRRPGPPKRPRDAAVASASRVRLTNLDKVFWPAEGYTKGDLVALLRRGRAADAPLPSRPAHRAHALSGRHRGQVVLPEGRAGVRARLGADGAGLLQGHRPGHRLLRRRRRGVAAVRGQHGHDPASTSGARGCRRSSVPTGSSSTSTRRARRSPTWCASRRPSTASSTSSSCRATRRRRAPPGSTSWSRSARRYTHEQAADARAAARDAGRARRVPDIATVARPLGARGGKVYVDFGQNGHGQTIVGAVLGAAAAGRAGLVPARVGRGHRAARPRPLHDPHRAAALRAAPRTRSRRCSRPGSTWPPLWRGWRRSSRHRAGARAPRAGAPAPAARHRRPRRRRSDQRRDARHQIVAIGNLT